MQRWQFAPLTKEQALACLSDQVWIRYQYVWYCNHIIFNCSFFYTEAWLVNFYGGKTYDNYRNLKIKTLEKRQYLWNLWNTGLNGICFWILWFKSNILYHILIYCFIYFKVYNQLHKRKNAKILMWIKKKNFNIF